MDFSTIKMNEPKCLTLVHPETNEPTDAKIWVYSPRSKFARNALAEAYRNNDKLEPTDLKDEWFFGRLVSKWEGIEYEGKAVECTPEKVEAFFIEQDWALFQAQMFVKGAEYAPKSSKPSRRGSSKKAG